jgi:hypothetical protein
LRALGLLPQARKKALDAGHRLKPNAVPNCSKKNGNNAWAISKKWLPSSVKLLHLRPSPKGTLTVTMRVPPGRETPRIESRDTGWVACVKQQDTEYTGTKVKGIATLHKSNGVPVFTDQEAIDISKMRR